MSAKDEKIALFIDGANLYTTAKSLGLDFSVSFSRAVICCGRFIIPPCLRIRKAFNPTTDRLA